MSQKRESQKNQPTNNERIEMGEMSYTIGVCHHNSYNQKKKTCKLKNVDNNTTLCPFFEIDVIFKRKLNLSQEKLEEKFEMYRASVFVNTCGEYMIKIIPSAKGFTLYAFVNTDVCHPKHYHEKFEKLKEFKYKTCLSDIDYMLKEFYGEEIKPDE